MSNDTCAMHDCDEPVEHLADTVFCRKHHAESVARNGGMSNEQIAIKVPEAEVLDEPWVFRAANHAKDPKAVEGFVGFGLILDLGFETYRQIEAALAGVIVDTEHTELVVEFVRNWIANAHPNPLTVTTLKHTGHVWLVHVERAELDGETLAVTHKSSLADALVEQGLCKRIEADA